jgi:inner membrane protein
MENFAHTLLGLSLAKAGLERTTPLATTALIIASNAPDVDVLVRLGGDASSYLEYHRGFTHSLLGLAVVAFVITLVLTFVDRRFRLHRDHRSRPMRPLRLFWLAYLGGLGHTFMDFTNNYGVRPFLPFNQHWVYGDYVYVVDPWIWLILGSTAVWLTATNSGRALTWLAIGVVVSLIMGFALREASRGIPPIPEVSRVVWFVGLGVVLIGALLKWGRRGERLARYSLLVLGVYYAGMWMAHQSAIARASSKPPDPEPVTKLAAWPTPADPTFWQAAAESDSATFSGTVRLRDPSTNWREESSLDPKMISSLMQSRDGQVFLGFSRFYSAKVTRNGEGYTVVLNDLRFSLQMEAQLDPDLNVRSTLTRWF